VDALVVGNGPVMLRNTVLLTKSMVNFVVAKIPVNGSEDVCADEQSHTV
jgi:hypothetical protein